MRTNVIFLVLIVSIFILSGCSSSELLKNKDLIVKDPSYCDSYAGAEKDVCYAIAANLRLEPELCSKVMSEEAQKTCLDEVAPEINNPEKCEKLSTQTQKDSCYINVAKFKKDVTYCNKIVNPDTACIDAVAIATNNESLCVYPYCFGQIAIVEKNPELCEKISTLPDIKDSDLNSEKLNCYRGYATTVNDPTFCFKDSDESLRNGCLAKIAQRTQDKSICEKIIVTEIPFNSTCYINREGKQECPIRPTINPPNRTEEYKQLNCYKYIN